MFFGVKPGWFLLLLVSLYAILASWGWRANALALREWYFEGIPEVHRSLPENPVPLALAEPLSGDVGLWFPIPGAGLPSDDAHLPGAERQYRAGVSEGFVFWPDSAGVPVVFGTPVIASASGEVIRADHAFRELDPGAWETLIGRVARGRVIASVGNSGTLAGVLGRNSQARLHFEIREGNSYVGAGLDPDGVRMLASALFTGP